MSFEQFGLPARVVIIMVVDRAVRAANPRKEEKVISFGLIDRKSEVGM